MSVVRYRPADAVRWLQMGSESAARDAQRRGQAAFRGGDDLRRNFRDAAGAIFGAGKTAVAQALHAQANASEYVLYEELMEIVQGAKTKTVRYNDVKSIEVKGDRARLVLREGEVKIDPPAHISVGRVRVPIGWERNGMEVAYDVLLDEIGARCKVPLETA
ncbi:MAG: hypothetical protein KIS66_03925 [Fimbriimonadaceae bacterium]|nr:hypothetical protein [Fimbriimonadaceae bacterium]